MHHSFGDRLFFSGINLGRDINFCSMQGTSSGETSSKDSSASSICANVNFFAGVSILGLMEILCTASGVWVACSMGVRVQRVF